MNTTCRYCNRKFKSNLSKGCHEPRCKENPCRVDMSGKNNPHYGKKGTNQWKNFDWSVVPFEDLKQGKRREFLFNEANYSCSQCGYNKRRDDGSIILEIDHVDGNPENNNRENLRVLCPNCHALTPTFRNFGNRGNRKTSPRIRKGNKDFKCP